MCVTDVLLCLIACCCACVLLCALLCAFNGVIVLLLLLLRLLCVPIVCSSAILVALNFCVLFFLRVLYEAFFVL